MLLSFILLTIGMIALKMDENSVAYFAFLALFLSLNYQINELKKLTQMLQKKLVDQAKNFKRLPKEDEFTKENTAKETPYETDYNAEDPLSSNPEKISPDQIKTDKENIGKTSDSERAASLKEIQDQVERNKAADKAEKQDVMAQASAATLKKTKALEEEVSSKWMFWVGGIAFALGGGFMVKYSIDNNLISPAVRIIMGFIIGMVMAIGGEYIRQKRLNAPKDKPSALEDKLSKTPDYLPSAVSAAGLLTAFAAIYSAYIIYDFISPIVTLVILTALAFLSTGLAFYQGKFFAYLGLIGGIILPMLVSTGGGEAWKLFPYLLIVISASLYAAQKKSWVDIAAAALGLSLVWVLLWIDTNWHVGDIIPLGLYLLIICGLNLYFLKGACSMRESGSSFKNLLSSKDITLISDVMMAFGILLFIAIMRIENYANSGFVMIGFGLSVLTWVIYRSSIKSRSGIFDMAAFLSIAGLLFLFATWHTADLLPTKDMVAGFNDPWVEVTSPDQYRFIGLSVLFGLLISALSFLGRKILLRKNFWASVSSSVPIIFLIIAYIRVENFAPSILFAGAALVLAVFQLLAIRGLIKDKSQDNIISLAAFAAGCTAAVALCAAMLLENAWLTFALSLELVALAHIWRITQVKDLRVLAGILASIILMRLFLNTQIFDYNIGELPLINWLFYGYGLTALFFIYAGRIFRKNIPDKNILDSILRIGSIMLGLAFATAEIHVLCSDGGYLISDLNDLEVALQSILWTGATAALYWYEVKHDDRLIRAVRRLMTVITLIAYITAGGIINNVFFNAYDGERSGISYHVIIFLQLFIPGLIYGFKAHLAYKINSGKSFKLYGAVAFITFWYWISADVAYIFKDVTASAGGWALYSYSAAWLLYAVALLSIGLKFDFHKMRLSGLFVLAVVVLKVFLVDMGSLEGLSRALSFMGLGATLIGLGALYQKLSRKKKEQEEP